MQGLELRARSRLFIGRTLTATRMLGIEPASAREENSLTGRPRTLVRETIVTAGLLSPRVVPPHPQGLQGSHLNLSQASAQRHRRYFLLNNKAVNFQDLKVAEESPPPAPRTCLRRAASSYFPPP